MAHEISEKFIEALDELEKTESTEKMVALFAENCEIGNVTLTNNLQGTDGAKEFWTNYRKTFGEIESNFKNKIYSENTVALEWTSCGTRADGGEINYDGVSIMETDGEKITRFYAYFNPSELGHQIVDEKSKSKEA
ncbi:MAG: nuclear transport factor 2 family protein [Pyrinomonadaceae bacterium]|nr:nuclear transport factor 2 family protein [Pyrinomonadaceae bacterium]